MRTFRGTVTLPPSASGSGRVAETPALGAGSPDAAWQRSPVQDQFASDLLDFLQEMQTESNSERAQSGEPAVDLDLNASGIAAAEDEEDASWMAGEPSFSF